MHYSVPNVAQMCNITCGRYIHIIKIQFNTLGKVFKELYVGTLTKYLHYYSIVADKMQCQVFLYILMFDYRTLGLLIPFVGKIVIMM